MSIFSICKQVQDPRIDRKRVHSVESIISYQDSAPQIVADMDM